MKHFKFLMIVLLALILWPTTMVSASEPSSSSKWTARYSCANEEAMGDEWYAEDFDDKSWSLVTGPMTADALSGKKYHYFRQWVYVSQEQIEDNQMRHELLFHGHVQCYVNGQNMTGVFGGGTYYHTTTDIANYFRPGYNLVATFYEDSYDEIRDLDFRIRPYDVGAPLQAFGMPYPAQPELALSKSQLAIYPTDNQAYSTAELIAAVFTPEGFGEDVEWSTDNADVATVVDGVVTAVGAGQTVITATGNYNGETASAQCQVDVLALPSEGKVVFLNEAGTLGNYLSQNEIEDLTKLTIFGPLNGTDVRLLRAMAGCDYSGNATGYSLEELDLTNARFVRGGDNYIRYGYTTEPSIIGNNMFEHCTSLRKIWLPSTLYEIRNRAFVSCTRLTEVHFSPDCGIAQIGHEAFSNTALASIDIPNSVTSLGSNVFHHTNLRSVKIPASVSEMGSCIFYDCPKLEEIIIPDDSQLTILPSGFAQSNPQLTTFYVPACIKNIESNVFAHSGLRNLIFAPGSQLAQVGAEAFAYCENLQSITLPESCTSLGNNIFYNCSSLQEAYLSSRLRALPEYAFAYCSALSNFTVPANVRVIGQSAFLGCYNLTTVVFPGNTQIRDLGENLFSSSHNLSALYMLAAEPPVCPNNLFEGSRDGIPVYVPETSVDAYKADSGWGRYNIQPVVNKPSFTLDKDNITLVGNVSDTYIRKQLKLRVFNPTGSNYTIRWQSADESIATVTQEGLVEFVNPGNTIVSAIVTLDGETITAECSVLCSLLDEDTPFFYVETPGTLRNMLTQQQIMNLTQIVILGEINGDDIRVLREMAGYDGASPTGYSLQEIDLSRATIVDNGLPEDAFRNAIELRKIWLPNITAIGYSAFAGCYHLSEVILPDYGLKSIGPYAFEGVAITNFSIPESVIEMRECAFRDCKQLVSVSIPDNGMLTSIPSSCFEGCDKLSTIDIPASIRTLEGAAFANSGLSSITFAPDIQLESIGSSAFSGCKNLKEIKIPESCIVLGDGVFWSCPLTDVKLPNGLRAIPRNAFNSCKNLQSIVIPAGVRVVGYEAFALCDNLKSVVFEQGTEIRDIATYAFGWSNNLQEIYLMTPEPPTCGDGVIIGPTPRIYVPSEAVDTYVSHQFWGQYEVLPYDGEKVFRISQESVDLYETSHESSCQKQLSIVSMSPHGPMDKELNWRSLDESIAKVTDDGFVYMVGEGTTQIVCSTIFEGTTYTAECTVNCHVPHNGELYVYVEKAGTLGGIIQPEQYATLTHLALFGEINSDDVKLIRTMSGYDYGNGDTVGHLQYLDLTEVNIKDGGGYGLGSMIENGLGYYMLAHCPSLETVHLPQSVIHGGGGGVFYDCENLQNVTLPEGIESLDFNFFANCPKLESVRIPAGIKSIRTDAFSNCPQLKSVHFDSANSRLQNIDSGCFRACESLSDITLPKTLQEIGGEAFKGCYALKSITIPAAVTTIGDAAFEGSGLTEVMIPYNSKLENIGKDAFYGISIKSFYIPVGVNEIGAAGINNNCLESVAVHEDHESYFALDGVLYRKKDQRIALMPHGRKGVWHTPDFLTSLPSSALFACQSLAGVVLGPNVISAGSNVFMGCNGLSFILCQNPEVVRASEETFNTLNTQHVSVFVPAVSFDAYKASSWGCFDQLYAIGEGDQLLISPRNVTLYDTPLQEMRVAQLTAVLVTGENAAEADVQWSIDNEDVATISPDGTLEVVGGGQAVVTATVSQGEKTVTATCSVTVVGAGTDDVLLYVAKAGTVGSMLSDDDRKHITRMTVLGVVNSDDLAVIGDMARSYGGHLAKLDLSQAQLVDGEIRWECFKDNVDLEEILFPVGLKRIESNAFQGASLKNVTIPSAVEYIGYYAFIESRVMDSFTLDDVVNCSDHILGSEGSPKVSRFNINISSVENDLDDMLRYYDDVSVVHYLSAGEELMSYTIPDGTRNIGRYYFYAGSAMEQVTVPASVESIGTHAMVGVPVVQLLGTIPPRLESSEGHTNRTTFIVPAEALEDYRNADVWRSLKLQIIPDNAQLALELSVIADDNKSALVVTGGEAALSYATSLTLHGTINSYDFFAFRTKMPNLHYLDLTDVEIVANPFEHYTGSYTEDHRLPRNAFMDMTKLYEIRLPERITEIGNQAFSGCVNLRNIVMHEGIEIIGDYAFETCRSMKRFDFPDGIKSVGHHVLSGCENLEEVNFGKGLLSVGSWLCYGGNALRKLKTVRFPDSTEYIGQEAFCNCYNLQNVQLPKALKDIAIYTFGYCTALETIVLPASLQAIHGDAFRGCSSLRELRLPPMLEQIDDYAFQGCDNLKDVYTYVVVPKDIAINQNTFSKTAYDQALLHVPDFSRYAYMWNTQWGQFQSMTEFTDTYDSFYAKNTLSLDGDTGGILGTPDATIHPTGGIEVSDDVSLALGEVDLNHNGTDGGSIIPDHEGNVSIQHLNVKIDVEANRWYFFCFPFNVALDAVEYDGEYVWRQYDGAARSRHEGGWRDLPSDATELIAGRGYIFQGTNTSVLHLNINEPEIRCGNASTELNEYVGADTQPADANWNFVGNPYTSYYTVDENTYSAPITIWTGHGYEAYRPGDDDYEFAPYQAFFVQSGNGKTVVNFDADNREGYEQAQETQSNRRMARVQKKVNPNRLLVNLELGVQGEDEYIDKTRVVFNDDCSLDYESDCDAAKFFSDERRAEIYTIGTDGTQYAINERPEEGGYVDLGFVANQKGKYTISAQRMDVPMLLIDDVMDTTFDLRNGAYEFSSAKGTFNKRFSLKRYEGITTSIKDLADQIGMTFSISDGSISVDGLDASTRVSLYNTAGQQIATQQGNGTITIQRQPASAPGTYVISVGKLTAKVIVK